MRGSAAIMRCSLVVPERGRPRIVMGPEMRSSAMRGFLTNSSLQQQSIGQDADQAGSLRGDTVVRQARLFVEGPHEPEQRFAWIDVAELGQPRGAPARRDQLVGVQRYRWRERGAHFDAVPAISSASGRDFTSTPPSTLM